MIRRSAHSVILGLLAFVGCSQAVTTPTVLRQQAVQVSADAPFVDVEGQKIGVDGLSPGETKSLQVSHFLNAEGRVGVDVDSAHEVQR